VVLECTTISNVLYISYKKFQPVVKAVELLGRPAWMPADN